MPDTFMVFPPKQPHNQLATVIQALGFAVVEWPSGRRTLEQYASNVIVSDLEQVLARDPKSLMRAKQLNLEATMRDFQHRTNVSGYFIKTKKRKKARKVDAVAWVHPNKYDGPIPNRHGVLL